uniref:MORN repeat protein n=1 Tax=Mucochytrium quahogii TaxID=96639 RepID=A0A7S2RAH0_9STRA|mmetsp:Transcript_5107/g.7779  ORF Transcript_5107/g.7779 Transcript_5107/m.7779 type:complete len:250 (+) Transcript_5107:170-919(+)
MGNESSKLETKTHRYPSGNVYTGQMKKGKRWGQGTYKWRDGTQYTGEWVNNEQCGMGVTNFPNGNLYEGQFEHNNPCGVGKLTTMNKEVIEGTWTCMGRSSNGPMAHECPVAKYELAVTVTDIESGRVTRYHGPATLHLQTGLVVLPGMDNPSMSVMPYATAVIAENGRELFSSAIAQPVAGNVPVVAVPVDSKNDLEQRLIDAEEQEEREAYAVQSDTIAYGVQDQALGPKPVHAHGKVELLNPRTYF